MGLLPCERETTIQGDDEFKKWKITTFQNKIKNKLIKIGATLIKELEDDGVEFELDFNQVSFRKKSSGRNMSQEQKDASRDRLASARKAKQDAKKEE